MNAFCKWAVALSVVVLAGCASAPKPADYVGEAPRLDLRQYFSGTVDGWGYVKDRSGKVVRRMYVEIICTWNGTEGTLDESFKWSDGKTEKRVWKIRKDGDRYIGTAGDVVGEALGGCHRQCIAMELRVETAAGAGCLRGQHGRLDVDDR